MTETSDPVVIKKYSNRRLYDTRQSKYITLEDLAAIVQAGHDVRVVDAKGGTDLTRQVLTQVILEQQDRLDMIPVELLHAIIRVQGTIQQAPLTAWLQGLAQQLSSTGSQWAQQMSQIFAGFGFGSPPPPRPEPPADPDAVTEPPPTPDDEVDDKAELDELKQRMDALLKRLGKDQS